jgi:hypothetical protein
MSVSPVRRGAIPAIRNPAIPAIRRPAVPTFRRGAIPASARTALMNAARGSFLALALALPLLMTGCRGGPDTGDESLVLEVAISPTPPVVGPARLIITLHDTAGVPLENAEILVEGNMSHAGMVPVLGTAEEEREGHYAVPDFRFTMAGDWIITARATLPDGRWVQTMTSTQVVGAPTGISPDTAGEGLDHDAHSGEPGEGAGHTSHTHEPGS